MGTPILVRTLEGDVDLIVSKDLYFMIGIEGEVIRSAKRSLKEPIVMSMKQQNLIWNTHLRFEIILMGRYTG